MKNYILPILVSLALGSHTVLAEEVTAPAQGANMPPFAEVPATTPPAKAETNNATPAAKPSTPEKMSSEELYKVIAGKRDEYRKSMFELGEKIHQASTPEEREKLIQEGKDKRQQHRQEVRELMSKGDFPMSPSPEAGYYDQRDFGYGPPGPGYGQGPGWRGQAPYGDERDLMPPPGHSGCPHFGNQNGPGNGMSSSGKGAHFEDMKKHHENVEKHLEKVEKLLEQVLEKLSK